MASRQGSGQRPWFRRVGWFILIWMASVTALAIVAAVLRALMNFAGLTA
jgi:hypothetical protein